MAEKVFKYRIVTQVDGKPLQTLENSLKNISSSLTNVNLGFSKLGNNIKSTMKGAKSDAEGLLSTLKGIAGVTAAIGAAGFVFSKVWDFGKAVVGAAKFKQTAISSLEVFYGDRSKNIFGNLIDIANKTPADTQPLLAFAQQLSGSRFSERQLGKLTTLRADVEAGGGSQSVLDSMANVFMSAAGGGAPELGSDYIQKFLGKDRYVRYQAKAAGISDWETGNLSQLNKKVNSARDSGKLTATAMVQGMEEATLSRLKQSKVGDMSKKIAQGSLAGALSNISNVFDNMLFSMDLDKAPGIKAFVKVLTNISDILLSPEFQTGLGEIVESIFKPFETFANSPDRIKTFITWIKNAFVAIGSVVGKLMDFFAKLSTANSFSEGIMTVIKSLESVFVYIGQLIGKGIKFAMFGGGPKEPSVPSTLRTASGDLDTKAADKLSKDLFPQVPKPNPNQTLLDNMNGRGVVVNNHIEVHGDGDPKQIAKEVSGATKSALDKSQQQKNLIKSGQGR